MKQLQVVKDLATDTEQGGFYQQNIIICVYIVSILCVCYASNIFIDVMVEHILFFTIYPHIVEILMRKFNQDGSKRDIWLGVILNAITLSFIPSFFDFEVTLIGVAFLMLSHQALFHLGILGWVVSMAIIYVGIGVTIFNSGFSGISDAPYQLEIVAITSGLTFMFYLAGNAYNNVIEIKKARGKVEALVAQQNKWVKLISRYLSPKIVEEIVSDKISGSEGYRKKPLTIFFSDIVGFTSISEQITTQELAYYLNDYLSEMSEVANKYNATIDKFIGDGIMIFFGDPSTKGPAGDVNNALSMAAEMQRSVSFLNKKWKGMGLGHSFRVRMGIHHGIATVGNFGASVQMNYTAIGSNVNLAARLEQSAPPAGILVSDEVKKLASEQFRFVDMEKVSLKGISEEVSVSLFDYKYEFVDKGSKTPSGKSLSIAIDKINEIRSLTLI